MKRHTAPSAGKAERSAAARSGQGKLKVMRDNRQNRDEQRMNQVNRKGHPK